ncbi:MAG: hypothetical protein AVDCRST_MAG87-3167 [uncultured Thermomicrobiales bacterium]|uniref:TPM domain-containing protein n=1 Tax=uncultured Thermomicrobiales bacterium TaxID=1645740 RepID=A0A6J4VH23_9BACT|nr:MAG: hypothetical protein AVDCRST_MAG87-3167 [uncultured Thermomicrobiales bacterium]
MSRSFSVRTKALPALTHGWALVAALVVVMAMCGTSTAQSSNPFDGTAPTPTPVPPGAGRGDIEFGPIREVGPRLRKALGGDDDLSPFMHLIEDPLGVLSKDQASELADDAQRLTAHGIPTMVIIRDSTRTREESAIDADELRARHALESTPGADDGLLFLVTRPRGPQGSRGSRQSMFLTISPGANTLPKGGLNDASLQEVQDRFIRPRMRFGLLADGLRVGMRKIIYLETYYPDPLPPLTSLQIAVRSALDVVAPIVTITGVGSVVAAWRRRGLQISARRSATWFPNVLALALAGFAVTSLAISSVYSQSRLGIVAVLVLTLVIAAHVRLLRRRPDITSQRSRVIHTSPRPAPTKARSLRPTRITPGSNRSPVATTPIR